MSLVSVAPFQLCLFDIQPILMYLGLRADHFFVLIVSLYRLINCFEIADRTLSGYSMDPLYLGQLNQTIEIFSWLITQN